VRWIGSRAAVTLPEHIDLSNADQLREQLLSVINRGATELIVDMTPTVSCDHAGADAVARAYQRLVGLRKDGATFPVQVSLSPVPTATSHLTLAVIRDVTEIRRRDDLADLAQAAAAAGQRDPGRELLDRVVYGLSRVGISLRSAIDQPTDVARQRITEALRRLDDTINEIRDYVFADRGASIPPDAGPADGEHQD
jgi:anti-anti-sigma regulatory factor